jgi:phosphate transport system substrate-binding protein
MKLKIAAVALLGLMFTAQSGMAQMKLNGAGATFPYPIYSKWFDLYHSKTGVEFNYQSIGSGGGIKQVIEGTVDFGATDAAMSEEQLAQVKEKQQSDVLHIPTVMGAVVVTFNIPGITKDLNLTPDAVAGIFLGDIKNWNDPRITSVNKDVKLPDLPIVVAHRSDGSGTTNIFTDYLTKANADWAKKVGKGPSVNWPVGLGGKGNEGVTGLIKQSEGSIGYVELAYAVKNNLPDAHIQNKSGNFVDASFESVSAAAAASTKDIPDDLRVSITNADGKDSYPISAFTWLLVYKDMKDKSKAVEIQKFLKWATTEGETYAKDLYYAPLPKAMMKLVDKKIAEISTK